MMTIHILHPRWSPPSVCTTAASARQESKHVRTKLGATLPGRPAILGVPLSWITHTHTHTHSKNKERNTALSWTAAQYVLLNG